MVKRRKKTRPIIGIIGGCGPIATIDIEKEILQSTQRIARPLLDQDYPSLIIYQYTQFHDRNDAECFKGKSPYRQYLNCANKLISIGANILLFACNTAHIYIKSLKKKIKVPIINMIDEVAKHSKTNYPNIIKIGLLSTEATDKAKLYQNAFKEHNISIITPNNTIKKQVMQAIYLIKSGINNQKTKNINNNSEISNHPHKKILLNQKLPNPKDLINNAIKHLKEKGCNYIILGCTELPLIINEIKNNKVILINPNKIVAEAVVKRYVNLIK